MISVLATTLFLIKLRTGVQHNLLQVNSGEFKIRIVTRPFLALGKVITRSKNGQVQKINGKHPWGTDGSLPLTEIVSFRISRRTSSFDLPKRYWSNCYDLAPGGRLGNRNAYLKVSGNNISLRILAANGAGTYLAVWVCDWKTKAVQSVQRNIEPDEDWRRVHVK